MKGGMVKGMLTGAMIGGSAAMIYGVMNWQTQRKLCAKAAKTGHWMAKKADAIFSGKM